MDHHFGIGLAFEGAPARFQFTAQRFEILDNAIVHHRDRAAGVRMGIVHRRRAMGGPAGMRDAGGPGSRLSHQLFRQILQLALGPAAIELAIMHGTDASGIITAIFQPLQPFDQPIGHIAASKNSNNAAHGSNAFVREYRERGCPAYLPENPWYFV